MRHRRATGRPVERAVRAGIAVSIVTICPARRGRGRAHHPLGTAATRSHISSRLFATAAVGALLLGFASSATAKDAAKAPAPATDAAAGPEIGDFGFDMAGMDRGVKPGDDFYAYANGTWAKTTAIPADKSNYGMFTALADLSQQRTREYWMRRRAIRTA